MARGGSSLLQKCLKAIVGTAFSEIAERPKSSIAILNQQLKFLGLQRDSLPRSEIHDALESVASFCRLIGRNRQPVTQSSRLATS